MSDADALIRDSFLRFEVECFRLDHVDGLMVVTKFAQQVGTNLVTLVA